MTFQCRTPSRDVQNHEHVDALKGGGHDHKEVAGQHGAGMVVKKCRPGLRRLTAAAGTWPTRHVAANRTRRQVRPSLTRSSAAIRSSAHVRFAAAMSAMSCWSSVGIGGRPRRLGVPLSVGSTSCGVQQREDDGRHETRPSDNSYNLNRLDAYGVVESHS